MSDPKNPLSAFSTHQIRHIMAAYRNTPDAESHVLKYSDGIAGEKVGGSGIIITNEFKDDRFIIPTFKWFWVKSGPTGMATTSLEGYIDIADRVGGQLLDWLRREVINAPGMEKTSLGNLTFAIKTYFIGNNAVASDNSSKVIHGNPLIFHVHDISDSMNSLSGGTKTRLFFSGAYNTTAQNPNISKPYQIVLTHKDGGLNNSDPEPPNGSCGILNRSQEDASFQKLRKDRLDKSKPIRTLKEAFEALETDLNEQAFVHTRQVQTWLSSIRDEYVKKIKPPEQKRGGKLPIEFKIELDGAYNTYKLDNRNLPFEQTEEKPDSTKGVTSIPFRAGSTISEIIDTIMKMSVKVGEDAAIPDNAKTYKTNLSYSVNSKKITVSIKIKQITAPLNSTKTDTGAGEGAIEPLSFTFKSGIADDVDITYLKTNISTDAGIKTLETPATDSEKKPLVIFGNRETQMGERITSTAPGEKYFETAFSGLRLPIIPYLNDGLENSEAAANVDIMNLIKSEQMSDHEIIIRGNPYLMSDLHRLPKHAAKLDSVGTAHYYKIPESYPMYIKLYIILENDAVIGLIRDQQLRSVNYYYRNHYEIIGVSNDLTDGKFYQSLMLRKTDDII